MEDRTHAFAIKEVFCSLAMKCNPKYSKGLNFTLGLDPISNWSREVPRVALRDVMLATNGIMGAITDLVAVIRESRIQPPDETEEILDICWQEKKEQLQRLVVLPGLRLISPYKSFFPPTPQEEVYNAEELQGENGLANKPQTKSLKKVICVLASQMGNHVVSAKSFFLLSAGDEWKYSCLSGLFLNYNDAMRMLNVLMQMVYDLLDLVREHVALPQDPAYDEAEEMLKLCWERQLRQSALYSPPNSSFALQEDKELVTLRAYADKYRRDEELSEYEKDLREVSIHDKIIYHFFFDDTAEKEEEAKMKAYREKELRDLQAYLDSLDPSSPEAAIHRLDDDPTPQTKAYARQNKSTRRRKGA